MAAVDGEHPPPNYDNPAPPPSYEAAVQMETSYASLDRNAGAARSQAPGGGIPDSPHDSDDEEISLLKAELRRLRLDKLEQTKRQLLEEIGRERTGSGTVPGRERTYSGTGSGIRAGTSGVSGSQSYHWAQPTTTTQYHPAAAPAELQPLTPQVISAPAAASNTIVHPVATASTSSYVPPSPTENGDKGTAVSCLKAVCITVLLVLLMLGVIAYFFPD